MSEQTISVVNSKALVGLLGTRDQHLRKIRESLGVSVSVYDNEIHIQGDEASVAQATQILEQLQTLALRQGLLAADDVARAIGEVRGGQAVSDAVVLDVYNGRQVRPKTPGQARYVTTMRGYDLVFCNGPAGSGKTYLAVAMAVAALKANQIRRIVLVRPAVEAGESLGFLPGDLQAKINPYLRPLFDALREMMEHDMIRRYTEEDLIEVIPLAYMRGRTLNESFIILDEAQNTTIAQMKMFLTRMGTSSKIVVSGDTTQVDLPPQTRSGLVDALERLHGIEGLASVLLTGADIVRHRLVQQIVDAYERPHRTRN
jgi:phosphate starvation-inducible PhoH-like protein